MDETDSIKAVFPVENADPPNYGYCGYSDAVTADCCVQFFADNESRVSITTLTFCRAETGGKAWKQWERWGDRGVDLTRLIVDFPTPEEICGGHQGKPSEGLTLLSAITTCFNEHVYKMFDDSSFVHGFTKWLLGGSSWENGGNTWGSAGNIGWGPSGSQWNSGYGQHGGSGGYGSGSNGGAGRYIELAQKLTSGDLSLAAAQSSVSPASFAIGGFTVGLIVVAVAQFAFSKRI